MGAAPVSEELGSAGQKRRSLGGEQLEPLSVRLLQAAGVLSLLLILVVVNSLLNDGGQSPFNPNPVAAAAERTQEAPGMRFSMEMRFTSEANPPVTIAGKGAYNGDTHLAGVSYRAESAQGPAMDIEAVLEDSAWYFRYPQFAERMPEGKEWVKVEGALGQSEENSMSAESPANSLRMLAAAGAVRRAGHARVRGEPTTRYRAILTPTGIVEALRAGGKDELADQFESVSAQLIGPVRSEVFIDRQGLLRRIHTRSSALADGTVVTTDLWMDLFAFGVAPDIRVPDDSLVFDLSPVLKEQLQAFGEAG